MAGHGAEARRDAQSQAGRVLHVLQVTDCHLLPDADGALQGVRTQVSLDRVLHAACQERTPDAVLATGDLAQEGVPETYALFLATLRRHYNGPLLCVPGNHDHGATFRDCLPTEDLVIGGWRLAGVDTHVDDVVGGSVAEAELGRLEAVLEDSQRPAGTQSVLVAGHHCPVATGARWLDEHRIDNGEALLAALRAHRARAYVFGHIHQPFEAPGAAPALFGTPSTCFQFASGSAEFALDRAALPGYRWLALAANGNITSRVGRAAPLSD